MMKAKTDPRAPLGMRWLILALTVLLTFLWVWLLGFVLDDIGHWPGPDYRVVEERYVDANLVQREKELQRRIQVFEKEIQRQKEIQQTLRQGMDNARATMEQMMELHRLSLEQQVTPNATEQEALATSQTRFLEAQDKFQEANEEISASNQDKFVLNQELGAVRETMQAQREPAQEEYRLARQRHEFKVACFKLAFIVPFFLLTAWLVYGKRRSFYRPIYISGFLACFWKVGVVMFDHFPRDYFKYIAIVTAVSIVLFFLAWLLQRSRHPSVLTLLKRFREAYAAHHCPICSYPIARGCLKQAVWTRHGPRWNAGVALDAEQSKDVPYSCPSCGRELYEVCGSCQAVRHSLLPYCDSCGEEKAVDELVEAP